jgi:hypothetical protein
MADENQESIKAARREGFIEGYTAAMRSYADFIANAVPPKKRPEERRSIRKSRPVLLRVAGRGIDQKGDGKVSKASPCPS